jgi:hypothetical protein
MSFTPWWKAEIKQSKTKVYFYITVTYCVELAISVKTTRCRRENDMCNVWADVTETSHEQINLFLAEPQEN